MKGHIEQHFKKAYDFFTQRKNGMAWTYVGAKEIEKGIFEHSFKVNGPKDFKSIDGQIVYLYTKIKEGKNPMLASLKGNKKSYDHNILKFKLEIDHEKIFKSFLKRPEIVLEFNEQFGIHKREELLALLNNIEKISGTVTPLYSIVSIDESNEKTILDGSTHHHFVVKGECNSIKIRISQNYDKKAGTIFISASVTKYSEDHKELPHKILEENYSIYKMEWESFPIKKYTKTEIGRNRILKFLEEAFNKEYLKFWAKEEKFIPEEISEEAEYFEQFKNQLKNLIDKVSDNNISTDFDFPRLKNMEPEKAFEFEQELSQFTKQLYLDTCSKRDSINRLIDLFNELKEYEFQESRYQKLKQLEIESLSKIIDALMSSLNGFQTKYQELLLLQHQISGKLLLLKTEQTIDMQKATHEEVLNKIKKIAL